MKKIKSTTLVFMLVFTMLFMTACSGGQPANVEKPDGETPETGTPETETPQQKDSIVVRLGHLGPETAPQQQFALRFKEEIEKKTDGRYKVEIFPNGILGKEREMSEMLQSGSLDFAFISTSVLTNFVPVTETLDLPFLFDSWEHAEKFIADPSAEEFMKETEQAKIKTLSLVCRGPRNVTNAKRPIKTAADFKGLKLRVIESPIFVQTFNALGASAQAMSFGEVFTALQQGTIDGQENPMVTNHYERMYEVQDYVTKTEHIFAFWSNYASEKFWESLSEDDQQIFTDVTVDVSKELGAIQREEEEMYAQKLIEEGMEINEIDKAPLRELVQPVYDQFAEKNTDKYFKIIESLK